MQLMARTSGQYGRKVRPSDIQDWWFRTFPISTWIQDPFLSIVNKSSHEDRVWAFFRAATEGRHRIMLTSYQLQGWNVDPSGWWAKTLRWGPKLLLFKAEFLASVAAVLKERKGPWPGSFVTQKPEPIKIHPQEYGGLEEDGLYDRLAKAIVEHEDPELAERTIGGRRFSTSLLQTVIESNYRFVKFNHPGIETGSNTSSLVPSFHRHIRGSFGPFMRLVRLHGDQPVSAEMVQDWLISRQSNLALRSSCWADLVDAVHLQLDLSDVRDERFDPPLFVWKLLDTLNRNFPIPQNYRPPLHHQEGFDGVLERHADMGRWIDHMVVFGSIRTRNAVPYSFDHFWPHTYSCARWRNAVALRSIRQRTIKSMVDEIFPKELAQIVKSFIPAELRTD